MEQVFHSLESIEKLEPGLREFLKNNLKLTRPAKNTFLLKEGEIANTIGFIEKGVVRGFRTKENDTERTIWFMMEYDIFISIRSFLKQVPATETVQTLEPCVIYSLTFQKYQELLKKYRSFQLHRAELLEKYYLLNEERENMRQQEGKFERLCFLMEHYPGLIGRVPEKYLASFIDTTPTYYSELKSKYLEMQQGKK